MDVSSIPKKYGGDLNFECGMMPSIDPEIRKCLDMKDPKLEELFLTGPTRWVDNEEGEMIALSVGSVDGKPHKEAVATMHSWAVRTATGSHTFQSQRTQPDYSASQPVSQPTSAPQSRPQSIGQTMSQMPIQPPPAQQPQPTVQTQPVAPIMPQQPPQIEPSQQMPPPFAPPPSAQTPFQTQTQTQSQPKTHAIIAPESEFILPNGSTVKSEPAFLDGQNERLNGGAAPPKGIALPPPQLQRTETQYMTPATEPSELKNFQ